jgi:hypothetical protein
VEIAYLRSADLSSLDKMQNDEISNGTWRNANRKSKTMKEMIEMVWMFNANERR